MASSSTASSSSSALDAAAMYAAKYGDLKLADCVNRVCPWSGKPVSADSLLRVPSGTAGAGGGYVAGFCNTGCRDKFVTALTMFETAAAAATAAAPAK